MTSFSGVLPAAAAWCLAIGLAAPAPARQDAALPPYHPDAGVAGALSSMGDPAMASLMDAWLAGLREAQPGISRGPVWDHSAAAKAFGALMFELADVAPLARDPLPTELGPYAHQFAGDIMKAPVLVCVGYLHERPAHVAVNKRPGSPLPSKVAAFLRFALSREGQALVARTPSWRALDAAQAAREREKLDGYLAPLDAALPSYEPGAPVRGALRSVGSDGMKSLVDRWFREFARLQSGVRKGDRWEHVGTLNGFHALVVGETDLAPMGRELWPDEAAAYAGTHGGRAPLEIRVARGGFNTPQRTTAQAVFVNERNPIQRLTVPQLAGILREPPAITRWGELGLTGDWANRPIAVYMPPRVAPNAMSMQSMVLKGAPWNRAAREGSIAETAAAAARDEGGLAFGGFEEGGPGLKTLALAASDGSPFYEGSGPNASSGRYPLVRYMYIRLDRPPAGTLRPHVREFLRYVLSRQGQEPVLYSGYFPLTAREVREELRKLREP